MQEVADRKSLEFVELFSISVVLQALTLADNKLKNKIITNTLNPVYSTLIISI